MKTKIFPIIFCISGIISAQVGINTNNPQNTLHIDGAKDNNISGLPSLTQQQNDVIVTSAGNVGIGTVVPGTRLEINNGTANGAIKIVDGTQGANKVLVSDANGVGSWRTLNPPTSEAIGFFSSTIANRQTTSIQYPNYTVITYPGESGDPTNSFDPLSGIYTVAVSGMYFFSASTQFDNTVLTGTPNYTTLGAIIVRETSSGTQTRISQQFFYITTRLFSVSLVGSVFCNAGDKITFRFTGVTDVSNSQYAVAASTFQGWKIAD